MLAKQILFGAPPSHNESPQRPQKVLKANLLGQTYSFNEHPCCIVYIQLWPFTSYKYLSPHLCNFKSNRNNQLQLTNKWLQLKETPWSRFAVLAVACLLATSTITISDDLSLDQNPQRIQKKSYWCLVGNGWEWGLLELSLPSGNLT